MALIRYYELEDVNDSSGNGFNLTNVGTTPFNAALFNNGMDQGTSNTTKWLKHISFGNLSISSGYSISFYIKINTAPASNTDNILFDLIVSDTTNAKQIRLVYQDVSGTKKLLARIFTNAWYDITYSVTLSTSSFQHIEFTYNGSTITKLYVDGVQQGGDGAVTDSSFAGATSNFYMGVSNGETSPSSVIFDRFKIFDAYNVTVISPSASVSASISPSASLSPSSSISASISPSSSVSASISPSSSVSPSIIVSPSSSISASISPSASLSPSSSASSSMSPSSSISPSSSVSSSLSPSASVSSSISPSSSISGSPSPSASVSPSISPSPSLGFSLYSREASISLPTNNNDLSTIYTDAEYEAVSVNEDVYVGQVGTQQYMIHEFKSFVGSHTRCNIEWEGNSSLAPDASTVYLQIYNQITQLWETVAHCDDAEAYQDFELEKKISDLTNYVGADHLISARVYQLAI